MPRPCAKRGCGLPAHRGFRFCAGQDVLNYGRRRGRGMSKIKTVYVRR